MIPHAPRNGRPPNIPLLASLQLVTLARRNHPDSTELRQHQRQRRNGWHRVVSQKNMNTEAMSRVTSGILGVRMIVLCIIIGSTVVDGFNSETFLQNHPPRLSWWLPAVSRSDPPNDDATIGTSTYHDPQYTLMTWNILAPGTSVIYIYCE